MRTVLTPALLVLALVGCDGARLDELDSTSSDQQARIAALEAENEDLREALDTLTARVDVLDGDVSGRVEAAESAITALQAETTSLGEAVDSAESRLDDAEADLVAQGAVVDTLGTRMDAVEEDVDALWAALTANISDIAANATDIAANAKSIGDLEADTSDRLGDLEDSATDWVNADTTLAVPGTYSTVQAALDSLDQSRIQGGTTVTIQIADGTHAQPGTIFVDHPDGARIEIVGASGDASKAVLTFSGSTGLFVPVGGSLGGLEHVTLRGNGAGSSSTSGVFMPPLSFISADDVVIENFAGDCVYSWGNAVFLAQNDSLVLDGCDEDGLEAGWGAIAIAQGAEITDQGEAGVYARDGAFIDVDAATVDMNGDVGLLARSYSAISAIEASADDNDSSGALAYRSAFIDVSDGSLSNNGLNGASATIHGLVNAYGVSARNNSGYGFAGTAYGVVDARTATVSGNGSGSSGTSTGGAVYE